MGDGSSRFICVYHGGLWYDGEGCDECAVDECFGDLEEREVREMSESRGDELLYEWLQEPPERTPEQPETPTTYAGQVIATALEQVRLDKALRRQPTPAMTWPQTRELVDGYMDRELPLGQPLAMPRGPGRCRRCWCRRCGILMGWSGGWWTPGPPPGPPGPLDGRPCRGV